MRILVVADDAPLAASIAQGLRGEGMTVDVVADGDVALGMGTRTRYDVVVLDRDAAGPSGDELCRVLIGRGLLARVLVLGPEAATEDNRDPRAVVGDDYLPKPFAFAELVARVHLLANRAPAAPRFISKGDLELDLVKRTVTRRGEPIDLTRKEFDVLCRLLIGEAEGRSTAELLERVWDEHADPFTTTVRVTMMTLRRKLGGDPPWDPGASV